MATTKIPLGTLIRVENLRSVWPNEAADFTQWLAQENLDGLGEALNIQMSLVETESKVGNYRADILCEDDNTGDIIVIENQLAVTNHDHLGKLITYAAGKDAKKVIWIVSRAGEDHSKAIEWLNNVTSIDWFLIEIELWKIGDSAIAPKFNIVEKPNGWGKQQKIETALSPRQKLLNRFWEKFNTLAVENKIFVKGGFKTGKAGFRPFYNLSIGKSSVGIALTVRTRKKEVGAALYFQDDKDLFYDFMSDKNEIETRLGAQLAWNEANKDCTMRISKKIDVIDEKTWEQSIHWLIEQSAKLKDIADCYIEE